ncbi:MAG TPA: ABC transporter permease, partial [Candidatus Polarisedimenticolia bacterium]|nr:ABC transporter permease [Candidatus Polarisedimenticolia bacterium]
REPGRPFAAVVINESLARELGAAPGDPILLTFPRGADAPPDTLLGRRETERQVGSTRCEVAAVIPDRGAGGFALSAHQSAPLNAYVRLEELQRAADRPGRVNALFVAPDTALKAADGDEREIDGALREALDPDDLGLIVSRTPERVTIEGRDFVLRPAVVDAVERIASELQARVQRVSTYLAIELRYRNRAVPYSTIAAISRAGHPFAGLFRPGGSPARPPAEGEILLNEWTMRELAAHPGDSIEMQYFVVGDGEQLVRRGAALTLAGEATMDGLGADPDLTPDYPGIKEARDIRAWDPPFPVELDRIRPADEAYWDTYGAAPKAFIGEETARSLWSSRYGIVTSLRLAPPEGEETAALESRLRRALVESLPLNLFGLEVRDLRAEATRAAEGSTDFGALFLGFSMFLIASSVLLAGLLFRLGVERRAGEIGLLLAVGLRERAVRRRFLAEGSVLAAIGCTLGCALGAAYAGLMMAGLRTLWRPAVGSSDLTLHLEPATLVAGSAASMLVVLLTIGWSVRSLARLSVPGLLAGRLAPESGRIAGRLPLLFAAGGTGLAAALLAWAMATGKQASPALSFGIGVCLLAGGLGWFARWCRSPGRRALSPGRSALAAMAARNMGWSPGRSILSASMIACASFVIVTVAVSRRAESSPDGGRDSPAGGFSLIAESRIPIHHDLSTRAGREGLDLPEENAALLDGTRIVALRSAPGDDASCLNLYRPDRPRLLGAPPEMVRRGGFLF